MKIYAGFWIRLFAGILDLAILALPIFILIFLTGSSQYDFFRLQNETQNTLEISATSTNYLANFIGYFVSIVYVTYCLSSSGQATIGKKLMGIYVARSDGAKLTKSRAMARAAASMLTTATLGLGFLIVVFTAEKISLHDFICDTRVFYRQKNVK